MATMLEECVTVTTVATVDEIKSDLAKLSERNFSSDPTAMFNRLLDQLAVALDATGVEWRREPKVGS